MNDMKVYLTDNVIRTFVDVVVVVFVCESVVSYLLFRDGFKRKIADGNC